MIGLVTERLAEQDARKGFLLDGFPRTLPQAEALDAALAGDDVRLNAVVLVEVPDDLIVARIVGRRTDPVTGDIWHLEFNPPPADVAGRLVQRKDDTEDACRERLAGYHGQTAPLVPHYAAKGLVRRIDGVGEPDEVTARIIDALGC